MLNHNPATEQPSVWAVRRRFMEPRQQLSARGWRIITFAAVFALFHCAIPIQSALAQSGDEPVETALPVLEGLAGQIDTLLANPSDFPLATRSRNALLKAFYVEAGEASLWADNGRMTGLINRLMRAQDDGLEATDYPIAELQGMMHVASQTDDRGRAIIELWFTTYFLKYARDLKVGRFLPGKIDPKLYWQEKKIDDAEALHAFQSIGDVDRFYDNWQPSIPEYGKLRQTLSEYRIISDGGGWRQVSPGEVLKPGATEPRVGELRARLAATDGAVPAGSVAEPNTFDDELIEAVKRFQSRHGLDADGIIGTKTLVQLNIPVDRRIRQIIVSMERWRWMPEDLGRHYIIVNIAGFELRRIRDRRLEEKMRVVVGKPYHQTPVFSNQVKYVEINPYWNVPYSIATKEELPKLQTNPAAIASKGFEVVSGDRVVSVTAVDWSQYSRKNFPFRLRQKPGPRNALGRVKFMFPNKFNVYMHDTPSRSLFARSARAFSHGCIRLGRPIDFAEQLLAGLPGWSRQRIDATVASQKRTVINLDAPVPVHLTYSTAWLGEDGTIQFRSDIYQRDVRLYAALFGKHRPMM
ncbi:MAG: L,D-transpeptidase family protein [Hyphomicrobiaceae bacterium]